MTPWRIWRDPAAVPRSPVWIYIPWFPCDWEAKEEGGEPFRNWGNSPQAAYFHTFPTFSPARRSSLCLYTPSERALAVLFLPLSGSHWIISLVWRRAGRVSEKSGSSSSWTRFEGLWPWPGEAVVGFLRWGPHRRCGITGTWVERRPRSCWPGPGGTAASWCGTVRVSTGLTLCVCCKYLGKEKFVGADNLCLRPAFCFIYPFFFFFKKRTFLVLRVFSQLALPSGSLKFWVKLTASLLLLHKLNCKLYI